mmetsp:Transcript_25965/g.21867  ORF Transcript_25965/g.21867 Transcript_25965/m.21867 type:complete len:156 (+) Transcript_25965:426-893(+)
MEEMHSKGKVRNLGLSNFGPEQLVDVMSFSKIKPCVNQIENHPYLNRNEFVKFMKKIGIVITAHSPLGSGDRPESLKSGLEPSVILLNNSVIAKIAEKHQITSAQVLIRFQLERGVSAIPKSVTFQRIKSNIDVFNIKLDHDDMREINGLNLDFH